MRLVGTVGRPSDDQAPALPIRVVVADRHPGTRRVLCLLLEPEDDCEVAAEVDSLATALHQLRRHRPHVLVLDPHPFDGPGLDAVRRLRQHAPGTAIVVVTMEDCRRLAVQAFHAGAIGFVLKDTADEELATAIRCAARGGHYVSPRMGLTPSSPNPVAGVPRWERVVVRASGPLHGASTESEPRKRRRGAKDPGQAGWVRAQSARWEGPAPGRIGGEAPELGSGDEAD